MPNDCVDWQSEFRLTPPSGALPYEVLAETYDALYGREQAEKYRAALSVVGALHGRVLDLGCGTGLLSLYIRAELLVGLDPCVPCLRVAAERGYEVVAGTGRLLPFRDSCFDAVFSFTVVHEDPAMVFEAIRVARSVVVVSVLRKVAELLPPIVRALESWGSVNVVDREGVKDVIVVACRGQAKGGPLEKGARGRGGRVRGQVRGER